MERDGQGPGNRRAGETGSGGRAGDRRAMPDEPAGAEAEAAAASEPGRLTASPTGFADAPRPGGGAGSWGEAGGPRSVEGTRRLPGLPPAAKGGLGAEEREVLQAVLAALHERGYDPARQLAHFLVTGEPAYITAHRGARVLAQRLDRVQVVEALVRACLMSGGGGVTGP